MMPGVNIFYRCILCLLFIKIVIGFDCYTCYYDITSPESWSRKECIDNPSILNYIPCNDTYYCTLQETYDPVKREFLSYFRSCGQVSIGNECVVEWNGLTCRGSCQGDFCNEDEIGNKSLAYASMKSSARNTSVQSAILIVCGLMLVYI